MTLDDFLTLTLPERIKWLRSSDGPRGQLSHDSFAAILGTSRQTVITWEKGKEPKQYAYKLAEFSGFPREAFLRRGAESLTAERPPLLEERVARLEHREAATRPLLERLEEMLSGANELEDEIAGGRGASSPPGTQQPSRLS